MASKMATTTIANPRTGDFLNGDIIYVICDYLNRKRDLSNLAKTSKYLYTTVTPRLYKEVTITPDLIQKREGAVFAAMISFSNPGLSSIRTVNISPDYGDGERWNQELLIGTEQLLLALPLDVLRTFKWACRTSLWLLCRW